MTATHSNYRLDIDGLRAVAVLSVISFHAFPRAVLGGFTGVDIFFVISGFLISGLIYAELGRGRFSFMGFYARRFRRIFPALITVLAASLIYGAFVLSPDEYRELGLQAAAGAGFSANLLFWSQAGYFDGSAALKPFLHLWSLGIEEQFYLAWPIVLVLVYDRSARTLYVACGLLLVSFIANILLTSSAPTAAFYSPLPRFWELLVGAVLAYGMQRRPDASPSTAVGNSLAVVGLACIVAAFCLIDKNAAFPGWWVLLPTLGTALVIAARDSWINQRLLANRFMVGIGLISYPLYLWHWVLFAFERIAYHGDEPPRSWRLWAIAATFILAWATYALIEKPIRFSRRRDALPKALLTGMLVCALLGVSIYVTNGFAFRYPQQIRALADFRYDAQRDANETADRSGSCFVGPTDDFTRMASLCVDRPGDPSPLVVLWGDSHAASLYPGLEAGSRRGGYRLAQFTASACPPVIGLESGKRKRCKAFNDFVLDEIRVLAPTVVVLEGHWSFYLSGYGGAKLDAEPLRATVQRLQALGIPRIVVMGSLPMWKIYQPRVTFDVWRRTHALPERTTDLLDLSAFTADRFVRDALAGTAAVVVSPLDFLCDHGACLLSADAHASVPVTWDNDHLSVAGSGLLASLDTAAILGSHGKNP